MTNVSQLVDCKAGPIPLLRSTVLPAAVGVGIAAGAVARLVQQATLEQKVPFTLRKHTLLLPVFAELLLGQFSFAQVSHHFQTLNTFWTSHLPSRRPQSAYSLRILVVS